MIETLKTLRVAGTSMLPTLQPSDRVIVEPIPYEQLQAGDVVVFAHDSRKVIHRLREPIGSAWITKGDNSRFRDAQPMGKTNYLGVARKAIRTQKNGNLETVFLNHGN